MKFLRAYDDDLAMLSLKVLASLACPPMTHKCIEENQHNTAIHKNPNLCHSFFEIGTYMKKEMLSNYTLIFR